MVIIRMLAKKKAFTILVSSSNSTCTGTSTPGRSSLLNFSPVVDIWKMRRKSESTSRKNFSPIKSKGPFLVGEDYLDFYVLTGFTSSAIHGQGKTH